MRSRRRCWWATSLAIAPIALLGCAAPMSAREVTDVPNVISGKAGRSGVVIAAPHGTSDARTGAIVREVARCTGFGVVVATGSTLPAEVYERRVREVARGPLVFYAEIHGSNHRDATNRIEIAAVGIDHDEALRLRALFELIRDAHVRVSRGAPRLEVLVEPSDAKRNGVLGLAQRTLQIELPQTARTEWREIYTGILADFLAQAVTLPSPR